MIECLYPDWPAPAHVKALVTTRSGGVSKDDGYASLNLAIHVDDDLVDVAENRRLLSAQLRLPSEPLWLNQVHGLAIVDADRLHPVSDEPPPADASMTRECHRVLAVLTADCLPVLLTNRTGSLVMAIHAGWRGLVDGILAESVASTDEEASDLLAWVGPGISGQAFEVGDEVREAFLRSGRAQEAHFRFDTDTHSWYADLPAIGLWQLHSLAVGWVGGGHWCTYSDAERWYSYRRDGAASGRMASLIWMQTA